jgi:hypothetical protein
MSNGADGGVQTVTFSAQLPSAMTRAYGDGTLATNLKYAVYPTGTKELDNNAENSITTGSATINNSSWTVQIDLVKGQSYDIYFWADKGEDSPYMFNGNNVTVSYDNIEANDDTRDAFFGKVTDFSTSSSTASVQLTRPFTQLNIATTDYTTAIQKHTTITGVTVATKAYTNFSFFDSALSGEKPVTISATTTSGEGSNTPEAEAAENSSSIFPTGAFPISGNQYTYLSMNYLFGADTEDVKLTINTTNSSSIETTISNVPFKANYRTNIAGSFLTNKQNFVVTVTPAFAGADTIDVWDGKTATVPNTNEKGTYIINSASDLAGFAALVNGTLTDTQTRSGETIDYASMDFTLTADIDLAGHDWTPIGTEARPYTGHFDGGNHTISNLKVSDIDYAGLFGSATDGAFIENLKVSNVNLIDCGEYVGALVGGLFCADVNNIVVDNVVANGNHYIGGVVGAGHCNVTECTVSNVNLLCVPNQKGDGTFDNGDKVGGIVGYVGRKTGTDPGTGYVISGNVTNAVIRGFRDLGGLVGAANVTTISGNVANITLTVDKNTNSYNDKTTNAGAFLGRDVDGTATVNRGTEINVGKIILSSDTEVTCEIYNLADLKLFRDEVNKGNTFAGKTINLNADINLAGEEWEPIGTENNPFHGIFNGGNKTISNLNIEKTGINCVGFFGRTNNGEVKNLTIENAIVKGRKDVGVVAGHPYTTKYNNITVKGDIKVNGYGNVGGMFGYQLYASASDLTVNANKGSYVDANSIENGKEYRTYVGGVVGFMGEGNITLLNVTSNIDVIGTTSDAGGITGIANYGNNFVDCTATGNVTLTHAYAETNSKSLGYLSVGGIAGVWHNGDGYTVTLTNCKFSGKLNSTDCDDEARIKDANVLVGTHYWPNGNGSLIINGVTYPGGSEMENRLPETAE